MFASSSSSSSSSSGSASASASSSSSSSSRHMQAIVPYYSQIYELRCSTTSDIPSIISEVDLPRLAYEYQIPLEHYRLHAPGVNDRGNSEMGEGRGIVVYEEHLRAGVRFPLDPFFMEVLAWYQLSMAQLHPNSWRIIVAFRALCESKDVIPSINVFDSIYSLKTRSNEDFSFFAAKKNCQLFRNLPSSLKNWKSKFFIISPVSGGSFGDFPASWNINRRRWTGQGILLHEEEGVVEEIKSLTVAKK